MTKAIILLSGGLDSATTSIIAQSQGYELHAISFSYGQRHEIELECARRVAHHLNIRRHKIIRINLADFGGSALTDVSLHVPKGRNEGEMSQDIPITYVPARNTIFLSYALAYAEVQGAQDIFIGVNAVDYSGYPDCRPEFVDQFTKLANLATAAAVKGEAEYRIHTPLMEMSKAEIITRGSQLGLDYSLTLSCYDPIVSGAEYLACGECDSCILRKNGFTAAKIQDPTIYVS